MPQMTLEEANRRISKAREKNAKELILSDCVELASLGALALPSNLENLALIRCSKLTDLSPLRGLKNLRVLNLGRCTALTDISPLSDLHGLTELSFSRCKKIKSIAPLSRLNNLRTLNLNRCVGIDDYNPLSSLHNLEILTANRTKISDLSALSSLTNLRKLDLSRTKVKNTEALKNLTKLLSLQLAECPEMESLELGRALTALQALSLKNCRSLSDLGSIQNANNLRRLNLRSCVSIRNIEGLNALKNLETLLLNGCTQVHDLSVLGSALMLRTLSAMDIGLTSLPTWLFNNHTLKTLYINILSDVPLEIQSAKRDDNCLPRIRAWKADSQDAPQNEDEVKVFVLGNGYSGKTQLVRMLQGLAYDERVSTTHGIQIASLEQNSAPLGIDARVNIWDFGGQDIYHGTHALFLKNHAVFLILWTPDLEQRSRANPSSVPEQHNTRYEDKARPLAYWVDYVRHLAGNESPICVVQSKCEQRLDEIRPEESLISQVKGIRLLSFSARTQYGKQSLLGAIRDAVKELHDKSPTPSIGHGWVAMRNEIRSRIAAGARTIELVEFEALCKINGKISDAKVLLEYLHRAGVVFYRENLFGGKIIIDQAWALEAIYSIFDRDKCVPYLRGDGTFTRSELDRLIWGNVRQLAKTAPYTNEEQELFISMMASCGICFYWKKNHSEESVWLAPELLPDKEMIRNHLVGRLRSSDLPSLKTIFRYGFLHEGIVRELFTTIGRYARDSAIYWKNGLWLYDDKTESYAVIEIRHSIKATSGAGEILMSFYGEKHRKLAETLNHIIHDIDPAPINLNTEAASPGGAGAKVSLEKSAFISPGSAPRGAPPAVYISYAWGDNTPAGKARGKIVDDLYIKLESAGFKPVRDIKEVRTGESIGAFIKQFGTADNVVAILSDKYLLSVACMTELHSLWQNCIGDAGRFQKRVHPLVLNDAKISQTSDRLERARHWKNQYNLLLQSQRDLGDGFGVEDQRELKLIGNFSREVSDMLRWLNDELIPREFTDSNDFIELISLLKKK